MPKPEKIDKALSDAARAVVRDPGDPRIDAHLAALGLGPDAPSPSPAHPITPAAEEAERRLADVSAQLANANTQLADAITRLEAERRRVLALGVALVIAVGLDIVLLVARLAG